MKIAAHKAAARLHKIALKAEKAAKHFAAKHHLDKSHLKRAEQKLKHKLTAAAHKVGSHISIASLEHTAAKLSVCTTSSNIYYSCFILLSLW